MTERFGEPPQPVVPAQGVTREREHRDKLGDPSFVKPHTTGGGCWCNPLIITYDAQGQEIDRRPEREEEEDES